MMTLTVQNITASHGFFETVASQWRSHGFFETIAGQWRSHGFFETIAGQWGHDIMLLLLASRWVAAVIGMWMNASITGKSLAFDALCLIAYACGLAHHASVLGDQWPTSMTGVIYLLNITMVAAHISLFLIIRAASNRVRPLR